MRKLIVKLSAAAMIVVGTVAALQAGASASPYMPVPQTGAAAPPRPIPSCPSPPR